MLVKFLVDRLGAKPLFLVCLVLGLITLIPIVFFPLSAVENVTASILFMFFLFFMLNFGYLGSEGIAQTYFLGLVPAEKMLDMGILYFFILGIAGASGTFLAGLLIDLFRFIGFSPFVSYKILFIIMMGLTILALTRQGKMKPLGSLPLSNALEVIFSFRDLRAISLLEKLNKAKDADEEKVLIGALHDTPSHLAIDGLLERARSPGLATRTDSIRALEQLDKLGKNAENALIEDIINNPYTTAYISARTLGKHHCTAAIPRLRKLAHSGDYMLAGESIIALAKMNDEAFRPEIEKIIINTQNPRLRIMGSEALGIYHNADSIPVLLDILRGNDKMPYLRDEIILAVAAITDTQKKFYKILTRYLSNNSLASALAFDEIEVTHEFVKTTLNKKTISKDNVAKIIECSGNFQNAVSAYAKDKNGEELSLWITALPSEYSRSTAAIRSIFSQTVLDDELNSYDCLRLLIIHWAAQELKIFAAMAK